MTEQQIVIDSGPLEPGDQRITLFNVSQTATTAQIMLAGTVIDNPLRSISPDLTLQLSRLSDTECVPFLEIPVQPRLTAVLHQYLEPASYCVIVVDALGALPQTVTVTTRVTSPALVKVSGEPGTLTFASTIAPAGTSSRTFQASSSGRLNVTLSSVTGGATEMGLGIGVFDNNVGVCRMAYTVTASPGTAPQISVNVDAGHYCAMLYDRGQLTAPQAFSISIEHP